jgi:hypothetical protein
MMAAARENRLYEGIAPIQTGSSFRSAVFGEKL